MAGEGVEDASDGQKINQYLDGMLATH